MTKPNLQIFLSLLITKALSKISQHSPIHICSHTNDRWLLYTLLACSKGSYLPGAVLDFSILHSGTSTCSSTSWISATPKEKKKKKTPAHCSDYRGATRQTYTTMIIKKHANKQTKKPNFFYHHGNLSKIWAYNKTPVCEGFENVTPYDTFTYVIWRREILLHMYVLTERKLCTPDIALLAVSLWPFYLPREFSTVVCDTHIHSSQSYCWQSKSSDDKDCASSSADYTGWNNFVMGDFNHCKLGKSMGNFNPFVTFTKWLDFLVWSNDTNDTNWNSSACEKKLSTGLAKN